MKENEGKFEKKKKRRSKNKKKRAQRGTPRDGPKN